MKTKSDKKRGFTLIELLVVISIISLLSSVVLTSLNDARDKAALSKFSQEVLQFKNAIQLYYEDNGSYSDLSFLSSDGFTEIVNYLVSQGYLAGEIELLPSITNQYFFTAPFILSCDGDWIDTSNKYGVFLVDSDFDYVKEFPNLFYNAINTSGDVIPNLYCIKNY